VVKARNSHRRLTDSTPPTADPATVRYHGILLGADSSQEQRFAVRAAYQRTAHRSIHHARDVPIASTLHRAS
jgi:hypothetical protein